MIKLYNEDCLGLNGMCKIEDKSVDMILCDLPFGITANRWDKVLPFDKLFEEYNRIIKDNGAIVLFGVQPFASKLIIANEKYFRYEIIWCKKKGSDFFNAKWKPLRAHENILVFYKKKPTYNPQKVKGEPYKGRPPRIRQESNWRPNFKLVDEGNPTGMRFPLTWIEWSKEQSKHPTQKPVGLLEWLIKTYTNSKEVILDNCMGSGSTGVACINTDRSFIGYELDEGYYKVAVERIKDAEMKKEVGVKS